MSSNDDSGLILLAAQGDRNAFSEIVRRHQQKEKTVETN